MNVMERLDYMFGKNNFMLSYLGLCRSEGTTFVLIELVHLGKS